MSIKRIIVAGLAALSITAGTLAASTSQSQAGSLSPGEAAAIAGGAGLLGGLIIGNAMNNHNRHGHYHPASAWELHVARCHAHYQSYREDIDAYLGFDNKWHRCRL